MTKLTTSFRDFVRTTATRCARLADLRTGSRHLVAGLVLAAAGLGAMPDAHAQRAFSRRFPAPAAQALNVEGDVALIGNVNLTCPTGSNSTDAGNASCASVQAGANGRNNGFAMTAVNVDADGTNTNSSTATLSLPSGSQVLFAGLYWGSVQGTAAARSSVRLKAPGAGYVTITTGAYGGTTDAIGSAYQSFADVTTLVQGAGNGAYTVGNVGLTAAAGNWAGWTLVVAYRKTGLQLRNLSVFDGFQAGNGANPQTDISISGFYTPPSGTVNSNVGFVLYDGDRGQNDDAGGQPSLLFGATTGSLNPVSDAINPIADFWNSSISFEGANVTAGRTPAYVNLLGVDIDNVRPNTPLPNGSTTAVARFRASDNDVNYPGVITLATDVFEPEIVTSFTKTATNANGTGTFRPGDTITYTIDLQNRGNDNANSVVVSDPLPTGVTYVPNSLVVVSGPNAGAKSDGAGDDQANYNAGARTVTFRLGTGASGAAGGTLVPTQATRITFQATIDANQANGATLSNVAGVSYVSATSGSNGSGNTPPSTITVTSNTDLAIVKTLASSNPVAAGGVVQYQLVVTNNGPQNVVGASVADAVPPQLTGVGATCVVNASACTAVNVAGNNVTATLSLTSGSSVTINVSGTTSSTPSAQVAANTATVATPSGVVDTATGNNSSTAPPVGVTTGVIDAVNDSGAIGGAAGGTAVANVRTNDTLNGVAVTGANVVTSFVSSTSAGVTLNASTGAVNVAPGTAPGVYTLVYRICETNAPSNCDTANVTVNVSAGAIDAFNDAGTATTAGGTAVANVLVNDTLGGAQATTSNVTLTQVSTTNTGVTLNAATGAIDVAGGTPPGSYTLVYRICEINAPANCDTATVTVNVSAGVIDAVNDTGTSTTAGTGGQALANVLANDTLAGAQATTSNVTLTLVSSTNAGVTLDTATGAVNVSAAVPAGSYTLTYRICETNAPSNCDTATVTVPVSAGAIDAIDDTGAATTAGTGGQALANVLANDTLAAAQATTSNVVLTLVSSTNAGVTLNTATGAVNVSAAVPAGSYTLTYRICETSAPANCDTATVTVPVSAGTIAAVNDTGAAGQGGGVAVANVLVNDTLGGAAATTSNVTLTQVSTTNAGVTLDTATGAVNVAPATPAGVYTLTYRICEAQVPSNCSTATVTVNVSAGAIDAVDDAGTPVTSAAGGQALANVLANDVLAGVPATTSNVILTQVSTTNAGVTLDTATGAVNVAAGTPAGTYTLTYRICETSAPANCDTATVSVPVSAGAIVANADTGTPVTTAAGGASVANVLVNDTLGGAAATTSNVVLSQVSTSNPGVTLNTATGAVNVAAGTPAGTYTLTYRICETVSPANCATATVSVVVSAGPIDAVNDTGTPVSGPTGGVAVPNVLGNDTLGGTPATTANTTLTQLSTSNPSIALNPGTGAVNVAPGTPAGTYTLTYRACETINPANCDTATVSVTVSAGPIDAVNDSGSVANGSNGGVAVANVLANDTLGGVTPTTANVDLTLVSSSNPNVTLDTSTGAVNVAPNTPAGPYTLVYRICERLLPSNCDTATATITVGAAPITATNDAAGPLNGANGGDAGINVVANDRLNGNPITLGTGGNATLAPVTSGPLTVNANGTVTVAPNTPAGTYTVTYAVCEALNPSNCASATVSVSVSAPAITATNDTATTPQNAAVTTNVLANDRLNGAAITPSQVTVSIATQPAHGTVVVNANGTITYTPAANYSGNDSYVYRICETLNPTNCANATVAVTVPVNVVDAIDDTMTTPQAGPVVITVIGNDSSPGAPLNPASITVVTPPANGTVVVNPATGTITYTPNTTFIGTDTLRYRVCDRSTPTPVCDTAQVTVTVTAARPQLRLVKTVPQRGVKIGDLVRYTVLVENTGISPANNATVIDTPPQGFTYVDGTLNVVDADNRFVLAGTAPIRINGVDVAVGGRATITYVLRVGAGVGRGTHTNQVSATDSTGTPVSNTATADVTVEGDPTIDDTLILGTVFVDTNGDGVQQVEDEPGLPGVRIASVEGLVIETDVHGRYHVAGIQASNAMRGSNFILKVDAATLPPGTTFTTSNPLVRRITPGIPVRFDFGVRSGSATSGNETR